MSIRKGGTNEPPIGPRPPRPQQVGTHKKFTFEEACLLSKCIVESTDFFQNIESSRIFLRDTLAEVGWTSSELADEAARRLRVSLDETIAAEDNDVHSRH